MSGLPLDYTPLESLLLFQSLACYGVDPQVFTRVSDLLLRNDAVKSAPGFSEDRLSPDALRDLYLRLLKDAVRDELQPQNENEQPVTNGDSPSRKRKAPSPSLPSVQEAAQHHHLLPQLIATLYARYRHHAIAEIREHEKRYEHFSRELRAIENGLWDDRLQREHQINGTKEAPQPSPPAEPSPIVAPPAAEVAPREPQGPVKPSPQPPQASPPGSKEQSPDSSQQSQAPRRSSAKIESIINHPSDTPANGSASPHQKPAAQSPVQPQAQTQPPPLQRTPSHPQQPQQQQQQPQPARPHPQQQPPHGPYPSPYGPPHTPAAAGPAQSPTLQNVPITSRPAQGPQQGSPQGPPVILPPPSNMQFSPPPMQVPSMQEGNGGPYPHRPASGSPHQQQRPFPPGPAPGPPPHSPHAYHPPPHVQQPGYYPQYAGQHPYPHHQPMYHPPVQHPPMPPKGGGGGVILEPFQVMAQDPVKAHKAQELQMRQQQQAQAARPPSRAAPSPRNIAATLAKPQQMPQFHPSAGPIPPYPHPNATPSVRRPPVLRISTRFGSWKQSLPPTDKPVSDSNPAPLSPITPERTPELQSSAPPSSTSKLKRAVKSKEMPAPDAAETPRPGRGSRKGARKARGTSVASSAVTGSVRGRTRSHSVASQADDPTTDVKAEPSTPAETMESDAQSTTETPTSGGRRTRRRAGTLQSVPEQPQGANNKRKRDQREESETAEPEVPDVDLNMGTPGPPNFVIASRNFGRMSVPVMNDITSHKHASLFSNPVKAKDAEGYYDIIRRPQDLKSIRAAITNGSRAVAAATQSNADTPSANSPGGAPSTPTQFPTSSTHITLPISEELVPPRGIVNSAQLEKELMRMFANAVMFNSGDEGVVGDAVEMAKDVEASVTNWRAAERTSVYETPAEDLDDGGGKRRKL